LPGPTRQSINIEKFLTMDARVKPAHDEVERTELLVSEPLVIVGNGMAAARLVDELAKSALGRYAIAVIGDEPRLAYNRVLLSAVLAGETASHDIELRPASWWRDRGVTLKYGCVATEIDLGRRELKIAGEESVTFSKLVLATGSAPLRLNVPGADLAGVYTFRDSRDVDLLLTLAARKKRVVVVGGGLLGLEAAYGLAKAGAPVTLIHLMDRLMERQLDAPAADLLKTLVERKGIEVLLNANTARLHGETHVGGVELTDGRRIDADAVIFAAGIRPNVALAKDAGISVNRGIVVDDHLQTRASDIFALGECAEHRGICYGLVEPAYEQAKVLAQHLAGGSASYGGSVVATNLKVSGVAVFSAGDFMGADGSETIVLNDARRGTCKKLVIANGHLTGAVLVGDTRDALWYLELIRGQEPIAKIRSDMMFGRSLAIRSEAA
jgi:nitrite reductase (NADH) large subunit